MHCRKVAVPWNFYILRNNAVYIDSYTVVISRNIATNFYFHLFSPPCQLLPYVLWNSGLSYWLHICATNIQNPNRTRSKAQHTAMNHDKSIMWRKTVQWERLESVSHGWPTLETPHNTAFVQAVTEALFGGAAADTSWPACWNNAWRTILKPAAYACTKSVKGYEKFLMLATSSLDKSTLSLEVERSFNRALTSLFPFFNVCLEQATRGFYGNWSTIDEFNIQRSNPWNVCVCVCDAVCVCVCQNEKKCQANGKHDKRHRRTGGSTSSKQQQAQRKENYKRKRPVSSVDYCHHVYVCVWVCVCVSMCVSQWKESTGWMASTTSATYWYAVVSTMKRKIQQQESRPIICRSLQSFGAITKVHRSPVKGTKLVSLENPSLPKTNKSSHFRLQLKTKVYTKHHLKPEVRFFRKPTPKRIFVRFTGLLRTCAMTPCRRKRGSSQVNLHVDSLPVSGPTVNGSVPAHACSMSPCFLRWDISILPTMEMCFSVILDISKLINFINWWFWRFRKLLLFSNWDRFTVTF